MIWAMASNVVGRYLSAMVCDGNGHHFHCEDTRIAISLASDGMYWVEKGRRWFPAGSVP